MIGDLSISVVIVNFNSGVLLRRCVESLVEQLAEVDELIVVDNGSVDGSLDFIVPSQRVVTIYAERNIGFSAACNLGVQMSTDSDWIVFLNPDTTVAIDWVVKIKAGIHRNPGFQAFACRMMKADSINVVDGVGDVYHISGRPRRRRHGSKLNEIKVSEEAVFSACGGAAVYKRQIFLDLGGFDESFFCYLEDVDLGFRLRLSGGRCLLLPEAIVYHVGSASAGFRSDFQVYYSQRNILWVYLKNMPMPLLICFLPLHVMLNFHGLFLCAIRGKFKVAVRAKLDALRGFSAICKARKESQGRRSLSSFEILKSLSFKFE